MGEGDVLAGCHIQGHHLEAGTLRLPFEERRPRLAIRIDSASTLIWRWRSNITMSSEWSASTPAMSPLCTASAQRSIRFRICRSSSVITYSTQSTALVRLLQ